MKKIIIITLIFVIISSSEIFSQVQGKFTTTPAIFAETPQTSHFSHDHGDYITDKFHTISGIKAYDSQLGSKSSMYLNKNWADGKVVLADGSVNDDWKLRYNIRFQQMQYISKDDTLAFADPTELSSITFDGHTFLFMDYINEDETSKSYLEVLNDGKSKLYLKRLITHHIKDFENDDPADDVYILNKTYYIRHGIETPARICLNKKRVIDCFPDKKEELKAFIKKNRIKMKGVNDLERLVDYYNSL